MSDLTDPCCRCVTVERARELVQIGTYTRPMGAGIQPGDPIVRPMCAPCREATATTTPAAGRAVIVGALAHVGLEPCGDNSCVFGSPGGMATNGGCRCVAERGPGQRQEDRRTILALARAVRRLAEEVAALRPRCPPGVPVEVRRDPDGAIDEIVARGADVHLEVMDRHRVWLGVTTPDGRTLHVDISAEVPARRKRPVIAVQTREG